LNGYGIEHGPDISTGEARSLLSAYQKRQRQQHAAQLEAQALKQLMPRLEAITAEVRGKLIPDWKPTLPQNSVEFQSYIEKINEALEHSLNYNTIGLHSTVLDRPSGGCYMVKVGFEISDQCMKRFRQAAFENYLKTERRIDEVACARKAGIQIERL
jgi:hypothetical protein